MVVTLEKVFLITEWWIDPLQVRECMPINNKHNYQASKDCFVPAGIPYNFQETDEVPDPLASLLFLQRAHDRACTGRCNVLVW